MIEKIIFDGINEESNCTGSGNCCNCGLFDCYYNDAIDPDIEDINWNAEMDVMEGIRSEGLL